MENSLTVPQKVKCRITLWFSNPPPRSMPKRTKSWESNRYLHICDHNSTIHNSYVVAAPALHRPLLLCKGSDPLQRPSGFQLPSNSKEVLFPFLQTCSSLVCSFLLLFWEAKTYRVTTKCSHSRFTHKIVQSLPVFVWGHVINRNGMKPH